MGFYLCGLYIDLQRSMSTLAETYQLPRQNSSLAKTHQTLGPKLTKSYDGRG